MMSSLTHSPIAVMMFTRTPDVAVEALLKVEFARRPDLSHAGDNAIDE